MLGSQIGVELVVALAMLTQEEQKFRFTLYHVQGLEGLLAQEAVNDTLPSPLV